MKTEIVIGLGFGDEGKGLATDYLCQQAQNPIVIRFNGGHQAGHTVITDGKRHVFSNFGSGSLRNVPTYWSRYCTFYPIGFLNEYHALLQLNHQPEFYLDYLSPVTTFYDVIYNRVLEESRTRHGSCGLGFGATIERHESFPKLFANDLLTPGILRLKLNAIAQYYEQKVNAAKNNRLSELYFDHDFKKAEELFLEASRSCVKLVRMVRERDLFKKLKDENFSFIFEGAQGILLDMDFGFFPHVTRSNTTSKNAVNIIKHNKLPDPSLYYVTRSYQTRHGAGPLSNECFPFEIKENEKETNVLNQWQGKFRKSILDPDFLKYAITCDTHFSGQFPKNLVITCLDQTRGAIPIIDGGILTDVNPVELAKEILPCYNEILLSSSDRTENIKKDGKRINPFNKSTYFVKGSFVGR